MRVKTYTYEDIIRIKKGLNKETFHYVKKLEEYIEIQQGTIQKAIKKIRELSKERKQDDNY